MTTAVDWLRVASHSADELARDLRFCDHPECRNLAYLASLMGRRLSRIRDEGPEPPEGYSDVPE